MDNTICPNCDEEIYINRIGAIGSWEWIKCDVCNHRHWRRFNGGMNELELREIRNGQLYAAILRGLPKMTEEEDIGGPISCPQCYTKLAKVVKNEVVLKWRNENGYCHKIFCQRCFGVSNDIRYGNGKREIQVIEKGRSK